MSSVLAWERIYIYITPALSWARRVGNIAALGAVCGEGFGRGLSHILPSFVHFILCFRRHIRLFVMWQRWTFHLSSPNLLSRFLSARQSLLIAFAHPDTPCFPSRSYFFFVSLIALSLASAFSSSAGHTHYAGSFSFCFNPQLTIFCAVSLALLRSGTAQPTAYLRTSLLRLPLKVNLLPLLCFLSWAPGVLLRKWFLVHCFPFSRSRGLFPEFFSHHFFPFFPHSPFAFCRIFFHFRLLFLVITGFLPFSN